MIKAISTLLTESAKIFLQKKLGSKDKQRVACQQLFNIYQILKEVRDEYRHMNIFLGYLKEIADDPRKDQWPVGFGYNNFYDINPRTWVRSYAREQMFSDRSRSMRKLFMYEVEDCIQRILVALTSFHGLMDEHVKGVTWRKDTWTLDKLDVLDQELSSKLNDAWFFDGGFICYLQYLSLSIDVSQHLLRIADYPYTPREGELFGATESFFKATREGKVDELDLTKSKDIIKIEEFINEGVLLLTNAVDALRVFIQNNCKLGDIM